MQGQSGHWLNTLCMAAASVSSVGPEVLTAGSWKGKVNVRWHAIPGVKWSLEGKLEPKWPSHFPQTDNFDDVGYLQKKLMPLVMERKRQLTQE